MNHNDTLSVVTLTFNNYHELIKTINSLKNIDSVESVIVNGGSCIETKEFLEKISHFNSIFCCITKFFICLFNYTHTKFTNLF